MPGAALSMMTWKRWKRMRRRESLRLVAEAELVCFVDRLMHDILS